MGRKSLFGAPAQPKTPVKQRKTLNLEPPPAAAPVPLPSDLYAALRELVIGQDEAIQRIVPFIYMHQAGLAPEGRPIGSALFVGPTGSGKTFLPEALAEIIHGNSKILLRIDCGEFQMEHEISKLTGAPPSYLGHRETPARLSQPRLTAARSTRSDITILVFDEVEKASQSLNKILLGILDKSILTLGDNTSVNFDNTLVFLTSNLGAKKIQKANRPDFGFETLVGPNVSPTVSSDIAIATCKKYFAPEFMNRIDAVVGFNLLDRSTLEVILNRILAEFATRVVMKLGVKGFIVHTTSAAKAKLLDEGVSTEYGARNLKRLVNRVLVFPVSERFATGQIPPGSTVTLAVSKGEFDIQVSQ